jgi:hypothetical protein
MLTEFNLLQISINDILDTDDAHVLNLRNMDIGDYEDTG